MEPLAPPKKVYDLEERTFLFAKNVRIFLRNLNMSESNLEDKKQLLRSSGSVGANFVEGKEALSKKDFILRLKICRKEAGESRYWLKLMEAHISNSNRLKAKLLIQEAFELTCIFGAIIRKNQANNA